MRSRASLPPWLLLLAGAWLGAAASPVHAQDIARNLAQGVEAQADPPPESQPLDPSRADGLHFTEEEIDAALERVKADPNLATERKMKTLRLKPRERSSGGTPTWLRWVGKVFSWLAEGGRYLFLGALAILAAFVLAYLWRLYRARGLTGRAPAFHAPSFVRDLDIRPESLPEDIGAAARALWDSGEHRSALALLYRGLLSRLVHVHRVPIRDSSTEGDCLRLVSIHLRSEERKRFVTSLVRLWQRAVYGGESVPTESVHALCAQFASALDAPEPSPSTADEPGGVAA